ncbi:head fiber protein [Sporolactobacillus terrae]|uniref:Head fiber protein n=1 Tax=Sporolactobacillus terrae TaxID=269673 RepID=A0A5K7X3E3_9BACL|nr:head fiber protein [Sporolactobacillus terrae]BBN99163.1 hypothetical protein St703_18680 [Sporolactobacillus terrae]
MSSVTFKATATADIAANHLISKTVTDTGITLAPTAAGAVPDYFATNAIKEGDEVSVTVSRPAAWNIVAGVAVKLGDSIAAGEGGTAVTGDEGAFGYAANAAAEGELVTVILIDKAGSGATSVTVDAITDASTIGKSVLKATDAAAVRTAIGAGTSNLALGTTSTTAKAGDYAPAWADVSGKPSTFAPVAATSSVVGGVKQAAIQADSTATDVAGLVTDFNTLLAKLRAAGIIAGS